MARPNGIGGHNTPSCSVAKVNECHFGRRVRSLLLRVSLLVSALLRELKIAAIGRAGQKCHFEPVNACFESSTTLTDSPESDAVTIERLTGRSHEPTRCERS
jgi:hypothetical protein